jgi:hypothetical protein
MFFLLRLASSVLFDAIGNYAVQFCASMQTQRMRSSLLGAPHVVLNHAPLLF